MPSSTSIQAGSMLLAIDTYAAPTPDRGAGAVLGALAALGAPLAAGALAFPPAPLGAAQAARTPPSIATRPTPRRQPPDRRIVGSLFPRAPPERPRQMHERRQRPHALQDGEDPDAEIHRIPGQHAGADRIQQVIA